jgi:hypothetical protein
VTALVFGACIFLRNWSFTQQTIFAKWFALPQQLAELAFGEVNDPETLGGALKIAGYYAMNFVFYYVLAALLLRQGPAAPIETEPDGD